MNACASVVALEEGRCAHEQIIQHGWDLDVFVGNSLVVGAWKMFREHSTRYHLKMQVTWNAVILGHAKYGQGQKALELFQQM